MSDWPKHSDGRNKKIGEMTAAERRSVFSGAAKTAEAYFARSEVKAGIRAALDATSTPN